MAHSMRIEFDQVVVRPLCTERYGNVALNLAITRDQRRSGDQPSLGKHPGSSRLITRSLATRGDQFPSPAHYAQGHFNPSAEGGARVARNVLTALLPRCRFESRFRKTRQFGGV